MSGHRCFIEEGLVTDNNREHIPLKSALKLFAGSAVCTLEPEQGVGGDRGRRGEGGGTNIYTQHSGAQSSQTIVALAWYFGGGEETRLALNYIL